VDVADRLGGEAFVPLRPAVLGPAGQAGGAASTGALAVPFELAVQPVHLLGAQAGECDAPSLGITWISAAVRWLSGVVGLAAGAFNHSVR
jgi:hypothetical protein